MSAAAYLFSAPDARARRDSIPNGYRVCREVFVKDLRALYLEQILPLNASEAFMEMFDVVGTSVAMGNASPEVQAAATHVTDSVDDDGIWNACVRLGLIG